MSYQNSHRIDLENATPCKHCGKETYTEYMCRPKYGRIHTDYHRYCPKCRSFKQTDDGGHIYCPRCITMYEEKLAVRRAREAAIRLEEKQYISTTGDVVYVVFVISFIIGWTWYCISKFSTVNAPTTTG